jgi:NAD(P)-dependent dehydrogenase (short-subunit alcohol dehydrogenase family)
MIIVTGANGRVGRTVTERLLERVPAEEIGVSVRAPEKARDLGTQGIRVRRGDFTDPSSLAHAFDGASQVLIVSADATGEAALRAHRAAIDATAAGANRILYTSHMGAHPDSPFVPMPDHADLADAAALVLTTGGNDLDGPAPGAHRPGGDRPGRYRGTRHAADGPPGPPRRRLRRRLLARLLGRPTATLADVLTATGCAGAGHADWVS